MELIINLIIVFVVIISILKRLKEVAGKGEEISDRREIPQEALSEQIENARDVMRSEQVEAEPEEEVEPFFPEKVTIEEVFRKFAEQQAPPNPEPFHEPEIPVIQKAPAFIVEPPPVITANVLRKMKKPREKSRERPPFLHFGGKEVVRGIVMSEILGDPVSMRDDSKW